MPFVERDGVNLYWESHGRGSPIVFVHPIATSRYFWSQQLFAFAAEHRVITLDLRGHGLSGKPGSGYGIDELGEDVLAVMNDAAAGNVTLVGNSLGAMAALATALDAPGRVGALVAVSGTTNLAPFVPAEARKAYRDDFEAAFDAMLERSVSARTQRDRREVCSFLANAWRVEDNFSPEVFLSCAEDPRGLFDWDVTARLKTLRIPALVIAGAEDQSMPPQAVKQLATDIPGAQFKLVPEVGHYYPLEAPAEFNEDLRAFLQQNGR